MIKLVKNKFNNIKNKFLYCFFFFNLINRKFININYNINI